MRLLFCVGLTLLSGSSARAAPPAAPASAEGGWTTLANAPRIKGKQDDVFFLDAQHGWSVNGLGQIFHTSDGGQSWKKQIDQPGTYFRAILFTDAQHGFAGNIGTGYFPGVTDPRPLFRTRDGGVTWQPVTEITGPRPTGICNFTAVDGKHLFATGRVGGPSYFMRSSDGGETWSSFDLGKSLATLIDAHFASPTEGVIIGGTSTDEKSETIVLRTTDGGTSWRRAYESTAGNGEMGWKLAFPSAKVGYASVLAFGGGPGVVLKTVDGGTTWARMPVSTTPFEGKGIGFIDEKVGWLGGGKTDLPGYRTVDGGVTWTVDRSLGAYVNRFRFIGDKLGYAIGAGIQKLIRP